MATKQNSAESTFIFTADSSIDSLKISRIQHQGLHHYTNKLSSSLQNLKNPFYQVLPLKFPANRIRKGGKNHILQQTQQPSYRTCIKTSELRNKQFDQKPWKPQRRQGVFFKNQRQTGKTCFYDIMPNSKSVDNILSSPQKTQKKHFQNKIVHQCLKDPILIGQKQKIFYNSSYQKIAKTPLVKRHQGEGFKHNLQWHQNKSSQKQKFNNRCKAIQKPNHIKIQQNKIIQAPRTERGQRDYQRRPTTYRQMYNIKKRINQ